ncbi:MAG TPA: hypothetical protein VEA38_09430 [Terriglobales bacterium]|nr:hypothetical protein [Terriglobales bacterium]
MPPSDFWLRSLAAGAAAAAASTLALAWTGRRELGSAATPMNGPSQWVWGRAAPYQDGADVKHTATGTVIHHAAAMIWGVLFEVLRRRAPRDVPGTVAAAVTTAAIANVVDFKLTPERLTPGFEKRLSRPALFEVYAAFAAGLALAGLVALRRAR